MDRSWVAGRPGERGAALAAAPTRTPCRPVRTGTSSAGPPRRTAAQDSADSLESRWYVEVWSGGTHDEQYRDGGIDDNRRILSVFRA